MGTIGQILANPTVVSAVLGIVLWAWHRVSSSSAAQSTALAHAISATRSAASAIVATIAPTATPDELAAKVTAAGYALLGEAGINTERLPPLAAAMLNAVAHEAVSDFVGVKQASTPAGTPASDALHAAIVNLSKSPPARAA